SRLLPEFVSFEFGLCARNAGVVAQGFIDLTAHPQLVEQDGQLPSHGDDRSFLGIASSSLGEFQSPSAQIAVLSKRSQNVVRALHHQGSEVSVESPKGLKQTTT